MDFDPDPVWIEVFPMTFFKA